MPTGPGEQRRRALRISVAVALSAIVQLVTTAWALQLRGPSLREHTRLAFAYYNPAATPFFYDRVHGAPRWLIAAAFVLALVGPVLMVFLRRHPGPVLAGITAAAVVGTVLISAHQYGAPFYVSVVFGVGAASWLRARVWAWACAGAYWLAFALSALSGDLLELGWLVPLTLLSVGALLGPEFGRSRREARARLVRDAEARRAEEAQAERVRIARELHDVLAHSLSQINVQASVGLHLFDTEPEKAAESLANVKETSKQALGEVRQVLGVLRGDEAPLAPEHGLESIRELVDGTAAQGLDATLRVDVADAARVSAAVQQAAYRIVQEALTNVAKHARAERVRVDLVEARGDGGWLLVAITDDGLGSVSAPSPDGRGLLGMRERAELLGGVFSAGARPDRGFEVRAELPLDGRA